MRTITITVDDEDERSINAAIATRQALSRLMPDGEGDLKGRVLAEVCRGYMDLLGWSKGESDE